MKIVIDTNVLVSGIFWKGPPNRILQLWISGRFELLISPEILDEYRRIAVELNRKYLNGRNDPILSEAIVAFTVIKINSVRVPLERQSIRRTSRVGGHEINTELADC